MRITLHSGDQHMVHPLLYAVVGDHQESCWTSATYEPHNTTRPCSSFKNLRDPDFDRVGPRHQIQWRSEDESAAWRKSMDEAILIGNIRLAATIQKKWSIHNIEVSGNSFCCNACSAMQ